MKTKWFDCYDSLWGKLIVCFVCSWLSSTCHGCCIHYLSAMLFILLCTWNTVGGIHGFLTCCMDFFSPSVSWL